MNAQRYVSIWIAVVVILSVASYAEARGGGGHSSSSGGYKPVHVNGYFRKDGTYVSPHYRSLPSNGTGYAPMSYPYATPNTAAPLPDQTVPVQSTTAITPPPAASVAVLPPPPAPTRVDECRGKGWCYVTFAPDGTQEARTNPVTDISYPPAPGVSMQRIIIFNRP